MRRPARPCHFCLRSPGFRVHVSSVVDRGEFGRCQLAAQVPSAGGQGQQVSALRTHLQGSAPRLGPLPTAGLSPGLDSVPRKAQAFEEATSNTGKLATKGTLKCVWLSSVF